MIHDLPTEDIAICVDFNTGDGVRSSVFHPAT